MLLKSHNKKLSTYLVTVKTFCREKILLKTYANLTQYIKVYKNSLISTV